MPEQKPRAATHAQAVSGSGSGTAAQNLSGASGTPGGDGASGASGGSGGSGMGISAAGAQTAERTRFAADELAIVLSHYDVGVLETVREYPRGSRKSPKLLLRGDRGPYLLKRRAPGKDDAYKVAFGHALQLHLAERQFPLPHLIGTRRDNNSMLQWNSRIYELFEFIQGAGYDNSLEATTDAGKTLALFHKLLRGFKCPYDPPRGSYHAAHTVDTSMHQIPHTLRKVVPASMAQQTEHVGHLLQFLHASYRDATRRAEDGGLADWPTQIVHSDWHPGNMLFRGSRVVAVIDYDAARIQQRILDVANGALQFSILGGSDDPSAWPETIDITRFKRFLRGYDSVPDNVLSSAEINTLPWLMIEALIAESVIPIAATGFFARMPGIPFLEMVRRKVGWLQKHVPHLIEAVDA